MQLLDDSAEDRTVWQPSGIFFFFDGVCVCVLVCLSGALACIKRHKRALYNLSYTPTFPLFLESAIRVPRAQQRVVVAYVCPCVWSR
jgi:hypothetical protein